MNPPGKELPNAPVKTAVILAAGMGTRLGERGRETPKGFLRLGRRPIVEESLLRLQLCGIERVVIATGHHSEAYEELAADHGDRVVTAHNPRFADSGSMYSLYGCREHLTDEDFLLLESDLVYERRALDVLLQAPERDVVLLSGSTHAGDEVYVEAAEGKLVAMSKERAHLESVAGELVGLSKISRELFAQMLDVAEPMFSRSLHVDYETGGLVAAGARHPVHCLTVPDLLWAEIDDEAHLTRARELVYPAIVERDGTLPEG